MYNTADININKLIVVVRLKFRRKHVEKVIVYQTMSIRARPRTAITKFSFVKRKMNFPTGKSPSKRKRPDLLC